MGFFDVPPPPRAEDDNDLDDEQEEYLEGRWLPGVLPVGQFIGRSEQAAVAARRILVLPDGFEIDIIAWVRKPPKRGHYLHGPFDREIVLGANGPEEIWDQNGRLSDQLVRFGVQFADGGRVTNLDQEPDWPDEPAPTEVYGTSVLSTRSAHIVARRTADLAAEAPEPGEAD